jgi:bloom syndrome protein
MDAKNNHFFGNSSYRLNQREVCNATLSGQDTFVLMPTGGAHLLFFCCPVVCAEQCYVIAGRCLCE